MSQMRKISRQAPLGSVELVGYPRGSAAGAPASAPNDSLSVTPAAGEFIRARAAVDAAPDLRDGRVAELRERVSRGEYRPDSAAIARHILDGGV